MMKMMKTRNNIYGTIASAMLMSAAASCSDNYNAVLEPVETATTLSAQIDGKDLSKISFNASPQDTTITVVSNTRWAVAVTDGGWCSVDVVGGRGEGKIKVSVLEDMTSDRNCDVVLYKLNAQGERIENGKWTIAVSQEASDVKLSPSSVEPFASQPLKGQEFQITANARWTLSVNYGKEDVEFVSIEPISGMSATGGGQYSGTGNAAFSITLQNNGTAAVRNATLELKSDAGSYSVEITQQKSENPFDVSPNNTQYIAPEGDSIDFHVLSSSGWGVSTNEPWISFSSDGQEDGSDSRVSLQAFISPNADGLPRRGTIHFTPKKQGYVPVDVEIIQNGYDLTFTGSLSNGETPVTAAGGMLTYSLDTRFGWRISAPDWMKINPGSGNGSDVRQAVEIGIEVNRTYSVRTDSVTIIPISTEFSGGVLLEPSKVGVYPIRFGVRQEGGGEPAISVPWLADGYTHTTATIKFNYYSPFVKIVEAGLQWKRENSDEWATEAVSVNDPTEGTVTVDLRSLDPATRYVVRGYVQDESGTPKYGSISYPFTTADQFPGSGDNPTPTPTK